jgi:membrane fusion protein, multidrug efflux system
MTKKFSGFLIIVLLAITAGGYWWFFRGGQAEEQAAGDKQETVQGPVAPVEVSPIKKGAVADEITVYGTIVPAAGAARTVAVPFESRVRRILVTEGQRVSQGDSLLEIEPSADTSLQIQQARNDYESARKAAEYMRQRFELKLATNDQVLQANQALEQAQAKLESMRRRGSEAPQIIHANAASLISKVAVPEGAIVPAGNSLLELIAQSRLEARLGVEPEILQRVRQGQDVALTRLNRSDSETVHSRVRKISRAADPTSRLVQIFAEVPSSANFLLGEYVAGKIAVSSAEGLVVPRSAVLPEEDQYVLFTVDQNRAKEHHVQVTLQNDREVEVIAPDLHSGDLAVILGNYELKDGMSVSVKKPR